MDDLKNRHAILVGLFVIVGLSFLVVGILMVGNLHDTFKKKVKLVSGQSVHQTLKGYMDMRSH